MTAETLSRFLLWCAILNYGLLLVWAAFALSPAGGLRRLYSRIFRIAPERFDDLNYAGLLAYKVAILFFNLVPYIALRIAG